MTTVYDIVKKLYGEDVANAAMPLITYAENRAAESVPENHFVANNKSGGFTALRYFSDMNPWIDFVVIVKSEDRYIAEKMIVLGMYEYWAEEFECYGDAVVSELESLNIDYKILYHDCDDESNEYEKPWSDIISTLDCETISDRAYPTDEKKCFIRECPDSKVDQVIFRSGDSAANILRLLTNVAKEYGYATVSDYYSLCEIKNEWTNEFYGWTTKKLSEVKVLLTNGGWTLDLPEPLPVDIR